MYLESPLILGESGSKSLVYTNNQNSPTFIRRHLFELSPLVDAMATTILSLPDELFLCIVDAVGDESEDPGNGPLLHWTISHVCRHLRNAVIDSPMLWTRIDTELSRPSSCKIFELYIQRSGTCKISVTLRHDGSDRKEGVMVGESMGTSSPSLDLLASHSNRIRRLTIVCDRTWMDKIMAFFHHIPIASLECLQLEVTNDYTYDGPLEMFNSGAPLLRSLKLINFWPIDSSLPSWLGSIVKFDLTKSRLSPRMIAACSSLRHLAVESSTCSGPIQTPSLTSLLLSLDDDDESTSALADSLANLTTPALISLTVVGCLHGDQIPALFRSMGLARSHLPALASLVFARFPGFCNCPDQLSYNYIPDTMSSLPLQTFPALASFAIIDICYAAKIIGDILGVHSIPWPLRAVTIGTEQRLQDVEDLYEALKGAVSAARQQMREIPKFRLSPSLFCLPYWQENAVDVELFEGMETSRS
ncbi:hypothetical protein C8J57DRAFT_1587779 [Mycena rebaudengoi]|nr:hypothetical protein C8J57DRAFT_1587779 [Mycena rebaudengoi]